MIFFVVIMEYKFYLFNYLLIFLFLCMFYTYVLYIGINNYSYCIVVRVLKQIAGTFGSVIFFFFKFDKIEFFTSKL